LCFEKREIVPENYVLFAKCIVGNMDDIGTLAIQPKQNEFPINIKRL